MALLHMYCYVSLTQVIKISARLICVLLPTKSTKPEYYSYYCKVLYTVFEILGSTAIGNACTCMHINATCLKQWYKGKAC